MDQEHRRPPSQEEVMFPEIKPLAEPMESANSFLPVPVCSVVPHSHYWANDKLSATLVGFASKLREGQLNKESGENAH